jgi:uroporphyrinogen-III synthase
MSRPVLVLRPQPGADATAARARERGLQAIVTPLFRIVPREWELPREPFDALLITSANAVPALDERLDRALPVYAVGAATARMVKSAGFARVTIGEAGVAEIVARASADGVSSILHLAGEDRTALDAGEIGIVARTVYAAEPVEPGAAFSEALQRKAVALLHSPRAARRFRELAGTGHSIVGFSQAVADAAGGGWAGAAIADRPTDDALLAAAARLCQ